MVQNQKVNNEIKNLSKEQLLKEQLSKEQLSKEQLSKEQLSKEQLSRESLFLRTNSPTETQITPHEERKTQLTLLPMQIIKEEFGGVTKIDDLENFEPKLISTSRKFCTLSIVLDNFDAITEKKLIYQVLKNTGDIVQSVCKSKKNLWGFFSYDTLYCFFSNKTQAQGKKIAEQITEKLSKKIKETVTIGIATYPTIHFKRSQIFGNAMKAIDHAHFFGPGTITCFDAVTLNISGDKFYQKGEIENAAAEFTNALLIDPKNVNLHNSLGVCYGVMLDYKKALNEFELAYTFDKSELMAIHNIGIIHDIEGDKKKALKYFSKAIKIKDDVFEILFHAGRLHNEMGSYKKAKQYLEKAVKIDSNSGPAQRNLAKSYECLNIRDEAITAYKKAIKINPYDADSLSALGNLFGSLNKNAEIALVFCKQSISLVPESGLFRYRLAKALLNIGQEEDAVFEFEKAKELGFSLDDKTKISKNSKSKKSPPKAKSTAKLK